MKTIVATYGDDPIRKARLQWVAMTLRNQLRFPFRLTNVKRWQ